MNLMYSYYEKITIYPTVWNGGGASPKYSLYTRIYAVDGNLPDYSD